MATPTKEKQEQKNREETEALASLGAHHDFIPVPIPATAPWAEGDEPFCENLDLNEYPVELLKMKKCRSFRADLRHKLTLIIRAHGGYGTQGVYRAAKRLGVCRQALLDWIKAKRAPASIHQYGLIDNVYAEALEKLVAEKISGQRIRK